VTKNLPSPKRAERNQARKAEFIPVWGFGVVIAAIVVIVVIAVLT
jgi:hypothetical protein